jgi:hypothetical protein
LLNHVVEMQRVDPIVMVELVSYVWKFMPKTVTGHAASPDASSTTTARTTTRRANGSRP